MEKLAVIDGVIAILEKEIEQGRRASKEAFEAATDEDAYSDGKYDTRSLEASYLAGGQAQIVKELGDALQGFKLLRAQHFMQPPLKQIGLGSLVEIESGGESSWYIIGPGGGGLDVDIDKTKITVLTLHSPLGRKLASKIKGDKIELPNGAGTVKSVV
ncbi:MAG: hypothetical protein KJT03_23820 [Verrucomicrobiae bacterium]|nr:hypothetical protein [Verrucomicrobiae bacterium]